MRGLFRLHDRKRFEIYVYALCKNDDSDYYQRIKADADQFIDLTDMTNADAASRIHRDGVHVLIDLMGYTAYARSEIFALQPAPVQVSYLGYPGTLGLPAVPYILADSVVLPEALQPFFTEHPVYLPECYQVNDRWQEIAETGIQRRDAGLPEDGPVFCCFNKPSKAGTGHVRGLDPDSRTGSGQRVVAAGLGTGGRRQSAAGGGMSRYRVANG